MGLQVIAQRVANALFSRYLPALENVGSGKSANTKIMVTQIKIYCITVLSAPVPALRTCCVRFAAISALCFSRPCCAVTYLTFDQSACTEQY